LFRVVDPEVPKDPDMDDRVQSINQIINKPKKLLRLLIGGSNAYLQFT